MKMAGIGECSDSTREILGAVVDTWIAIVFSINFRFNDIYLSLL